MQGQPKIVNDGQWTWCMTATSLPVPAHATQLPTGTGRHTVVCVVARRLTKSAA